MQTMPCNEAVARQGRSDQYSLACTAFQLLTGEAPFADSNAAIIIAGHLGRPMPSVRVRRPDLAPVVDEVLARATAKSPDGRFPSCSEFAEALEHATAAPAPVGGFLTPPVAPIDDPDRTVVPSIGDPNPTVVPARPAGPGDDGPTAVRPQPGKSRRRVMLATGAGVLVIALVAGVVVWQRGGSDAPGVSPEAAGLPKIMATPYLGSLAQKPAGPKWTYTPPPTQDYQRMTGVIGGTTATAMISRTTGSDEFLDLVSAETGSLQRTIPLGRDRLDTCAAETEGKMALCRDTAGSDGRIAVIDLVNGTSTIIRTGLSGIQEPYTDGDRFIINGSVRGGAREARAYDSVGKLVWREAMPSLIPLPGSGVVASVTDTGGPYSKIVLSVRRVTDGKEVLRREATSADQRPAVAGFAGGFAVTTARTTELFSSDGARTAQIPMGWTVLDGETAFGFLYRVSSLPVLVDLQTDRIAAFNPRTGTMLWSGKGVDSPFGGGIGGPGVAVGFGTKVVQIRFRKYTSEDGYWDARWFDAYTGAGNSFKLAGTGLADGAKAKVLGTDGSTFATSISAGPSEGSSLSAPLPGGSDAWTIKYTNNLNGTMVTACAGRIYAGATRVL